MDLNQLLFSHQLDLMNASASADPGRRTRHLASAGHTASTIARFQRVVGARMPLLPARYTAALCA